MASESQWVDEGVEEQADSNNRSGTWRQPWQMIIREGRWWPLFNNIMRKRGVSKNRIHTMQFTACRHEMPHHIYGQSPSHLQASCSCGFPSRSITVAVCSTHLLTTGFSLESFSKCREKEQHGLFKKLSIAPTEGTAAWRSVVQRFQHITGAFSVSLWVIIFWVTKAPFLG